MKSVLQYIGAFDFSALRSVFGAILLFIVLKLRGRKSGMPPLWPALAIGALQTGGMVGFSQWALVVGGAGKVAIITYTMPFWVIILAALFLGERMRKLQYIAILVAAVGLTLVLQPWDFHGSVAAPLLALLSGVSWGASTVVAKRMYARHQVDLLSLTAWQMAFGALLLSVIALCVHEKPIVWSPYVFAALSYTSILATAFAWVLWMFVLKSLPAGIASLSTLAVPVLGVFFSWWLLNEVPNQPEIVGIVLIVLALAAISLGNRKPKSKVVKINH